MVLPENSGLIQDLFRGAERGRAFGIFGAVIGLSTATGPVVGGLILSTSSSTEDWPWIFYIRRRRGVLGPRRGRC